MSRESGIEWTQSTWNPVTGCTKVSPGCAHCYAERMAHRLQGMGVPGYEHGFDVAVHPDRFSEPYRWRKPRRVFVCSMGDLFHDDISNNATSAIWRVMADNDRHIFQVLTKRARSLATFWYPFHWWPRPMAPNVHVGVTVENRAHGLPRIEHLRRVPAAVRFLSIEPLLEDLGPLDLTGIGWVIVGGESGPGARPMAADWVRYIRDQCQAAGVPFFFKQWGGTNKKAAGRMLDGREWSETP